MMTASQLRYADICDRYPGIPVFAQHWWLQAVHPSWDAVFAGDDNHMKGVWPYCRDKKLGVTLLRNPQLTPYLGPHVLYPHDMKAANKDAHAWETITDLMGQMPPSPYWNLAVAPGMKQAGIFKQHNLQLTVRQTFLMDLSQSEQQLMANMKDSLRKNIRQAATEITISNDPKALPLLYAFHKSTLGKKSRDIYHTLSTMEQLLQACIAHDAGALWVARQGETVQAIIWHVWDTECGYYFMGAQNPEASNNKAMSALIWQAIRQTQQQNIPTFDLEGSMDPGVERFYRGFGAERELYLVLQKNDSRLWRLKEWLR